MWKRSDCGIGFFCLTTRKQLKIKGPNKYNAIGMACFISNFHAKIESASAKCLGDKFMNLKIYFMFLK